MANATMFIRGNSSQKDKQQIYKTGYLVPVLSVSELLASSRHKSLVSEIKQISGLSEEDADNLYDPTIKNFAEFVQVIPAEVNGVMSGLLNQGLARAAIVLQKYLLEHGAANSNPLMNYAIFTSVLFSDISKVIINQKVNIVDEQGNFIKEWRPFNRSLVGNGEYYTMLPKSPGYQRLQRSLTILLARQLMPKEGFLWIAGDPQVFADWLDALNDDSSQGGRLSLFLNKMKREDIYALISVLQQVPVNINPAAANEFGDQFYNWLRNNIENGDIKVNTADAPIHVVDEGVFLEHRLFKQFADLASVPVNMMVVHSQFGNLMGIPKKDGLDFVHDQYFSKHGGDGYSKALAGSLTGKHNSLREGLLLSDPSLIFSRNQNVAVSPLMKAIHSKGMNYHDAPPKINQSQRQAAEMKATAKA